MKHETILPHPALKRYIRHFWSLKFDATPGGTKTFKMFARKYPRMIFQHAHGASSISTNGKSLPLAYLGGLNTQPYDCEICLDATSIVGVSFYPDALHELFGIDASEMVNLTPELINFMPPDVIRMVMDTDDEGMKIRILEDFLLTKAAENTGRNGYFNNAWKVINDHPTSVPLRSIYPLFSHSERHFRRRFQEMTGYKPKQFLRITRFEKALAVLKGNTDKSLTNVGYECGYTDQSHFIREFREFAGLTPTSYLKTGKLYEENAAFIPR